MHSAADLGQRWRAVMGPLGFGERLLWVGFVGPDRRLIKAWARFVELGTSPKRAAIEHSCRRCTTYSADFKEGTTVALLLTRPGPRTNLGSDRQRALLTNSPNSVH